MDVCLSVHSETGVFIFDWIGHPRANMHAFVTGERIQFNLIPVNSPDPVITGVNSWVSGMGRGN
jgi:hypothetical protein